jgi:hypothetical protein
MQSAWAGVSHLSQQRTADAVLRTRVHRTAKIDDNAEEGKKPRNRTEPSRQHLGVVIENRLQVYSWCFI